MEMNTRIQVEHPVTEMVTGIDIVKEQIKIASGQKLSIKQDDVKIKGHAIECRINAEDPKNNFAPSPGKITDLNIPAGFGVRMDSAIYCGYEIPPFYDSMIGKLITYGETREEARIRMKRCLSEFAIGGIKNNLEFHYRLLEDKDFKEGNYYTSFLSEKMGEKR